jgi:uncharacterized protein YjbI with pentapeptide repeats
LVCEFLIHRGFIGGGLLWRPVSEEQGTSVGRKSVWTVLKDNAALVTAVIALFGVLIAGAFDTVIANRAQEAQRELEADNAKSQRELEAFNAQKQRELEEAKAQNAALQTYLDQMGQMLLKQNLDLSEEDSEVRSLARARTLAVFGQLNPEGKRIALVYLNETDLIEGDNPIISLFSADLSEANLSGTNLFEPYLSGTNLREANLRGARLVGAYLSGTNLSEANLRGATLSKAKLIDANLRGANLSKAKLISADLSYADLTGAQRWTEDQLSEASTLTGATMPDGQILKDAYDPDRPTFEEWLKSTDQDENKKSDGSS